MQKIKKTKKIDSVKTLAQGYHQHSWSGQAYAFSGYSKNLYFTSDRFIELDDEFNALDGKTILKGYGLEIETGCEYSMSSDMKAHFINDTILKNATLDEKLFKYQEDGSISGIECITQVMTKERIRNDYFKWMAYFDGLKKYGFLPDETCGMHVNISNYLLGSTQEKQIDSIKKLVYLIDTNYKLFARLFNRDLSCTRFCDRFNRDKETIKNTDILSDSFNFLNNNDHYRWFNGSHFKVGRVELRLVGPQNSYESFRNTMESVFFIVERIKDIAWRDLDNLAKVFMGVNAHVLDRLSRCRNEGWLSDNVFEEIKAKATDVEYYKRQR